MATTSHPRYRQLIKDIDAFCQTQGWDVPSHFPEIVEAEVTGLVEGLARQLGITTQSVWAGYGDVFEAETIATRLWDALNEDENNLLGTESVTLSIAKAARVLVSLGQVSLSVVTGRATLKTKRGTMESLSLLTAASNAITDISFCISEAAKTGQDSVQLKGAVVYQAVSSMEGTISRFNRGTWSTGDASHDDLIVRGIKSDMQHLVAA